jgi:hypothetical protein
MRSETLDAIGRDGSVLRAEFLWRGDRYGHLISAGSLGSDMLPLLESLEGTSIDDWPLSPPLVSLHRERLTDGRAALLLVGAAGRGYWSASVVAAVGEAGLVFDIACRHGVEPAWLGSKYTTNAAAASRLTIGLEDAKATWAQEQLAIEPAQDKRALTTRWRFSLALTPDS